MKKVQINMILPKLLAFLSAGLFASSAHAQTTSASSGNAGGIATTIAGSFSGVGNMMLGGAFLGGVGLCGAGLLKLKTAADSQGRDAKYSDGIWRLGIGAGLVALPAVTNVMKTTVMGTNSTNVTAPTGVTWTTQ
jgi:hypothetical protein